MIMKPIAPNKEDDKPGRPNEVPVPDQDPKTVPGEEPAPDVWPRRSPEVQPEEEPLTRPPDAPSEIPSPPGYLIPDVRRDRTVFEF